MILSPNDTLIPEETAMRALVFVVALAVTCLAALDAPALTQTQIDAKEAAWLAEYYDLDAEMNEAETEEEFFEAFDAMMALNEEREAWYESNGVEEWEWYWPSGWGRG